MANQVRTDMNGISVVQIGMNTADLAGSLRLYNELFGFLNAGGNAFWGEGMRIQGLNPDTDHSLIWWMVSGKPFFQLEFFSYGSPKQRPQPADWRPCDHGWVRFGLSVDDFERVVRGLNRWRIPLLGSTGSKSRRRLAFRDPHVGSIVEVIESQGMKCPTLAYATSSVADIDESRHFYGEVVGGKIEPMENLHEPDDEILWGLGNAARKGFLVRLGDTVLEIVQYVNPVGKPRRADYMICDQGIMNIALGARNLETVRALIERIREDGHAPTEVLERTDMIATYITDAGCELEILAGSEALDAALGFVPAAPFLSEFAPKI
jgi:catechol 2,3-dioxygenase-like lactoylglutathione lyase family enzyme